MLPTYAKRFGLLRNPEVTKEIARLDARRDCQRIVHLLAAYEFPWDFQRALELALFYTYGSDTVAKLLDRTGEFHEHGQKRYDDTRLLMTHIIDSGWDGEIGRRALARMNKSHGHYRIANDDFLFVLWTFIEFPIRWSRAYAHRAMTPHEELAWFHFWAGVGERMGLLGIPATKEAFDRFVRDYETMHFVPNEASRRVAASTVHILEGWFPSPSEPRRAGRLLALRRRPALPRRHRRRRAAPVRAPPRGRRAEDARPRQARPRPRRLPVPPGLADEPHLRREALPRGRPPPGRARGEGSLPTGPRRPAGLRYESEAGAGPRVRPVAVGLAAHAEATAQGESRLNACAAAMSRGALSFSTRPSSAISEMWYRRRPIDEGTRL